MLGTIRTPTHYINSKHCGIPISLKQKNGGACHIKSAAPQRKRDLILCVLYAYIHRMFLEEEPIQSLSDGGAENDRGYGFNYTIKCNNSKHHIEKSLFVCRTKACHACFASKQIESTKEEYGIGESTNESG